MHWINVVWILAAALSAAAMALFAFALDFGWYGLIAGPPIFVVASVLVPFFLGVQDRKREAAAKHEQRKTSRFIGRQPIGTPIKKRVNQPAPAVANAMKASWAESAGRGPTGHSPLPLLVAAAERGSRGSTSKPARV
jgi:hypothetical protein